MTATVSKKKKTDKLSSLPELTPNCPYCGSKNVFGMSRVVGYFSVIENWNASKRAELKRRHKGNYWTKKKL